MIKLAINKLIQRRDLSAEESKKVMGQIISGETSPALVAAYLTALRESRMMAALLWVDHSDPSLPFFNPETEG